MRCRPPRRSATTGSRSRPTGRVNPESVDARLLRASGRSGSPSDTRPATRTSATPSPRATLGRRTTAVDAVAERYLATFAALDPCAATEMGIVGHDDDITDYSPDGVAARAEAARSALRELDGATAADDVDVVTSRRCANDSVVQIELHDARTRCRRAERDRVAAAVDARRVRPDGHRHRRGLGADRPAAVAGARPGRGLRRRHCARRWRPGVRPRPGRSARGIEQAGQIQQLFVDMVADARARTTTRCMRSLQQRASAAADAYSRLAAVLRDEIGPHARRRGRVRPRRLPAVLAGISSARQSISTRPIEWGLRQLECIVAEQESIAHRLYPGSSVAEALRRLDEEPRYRRARHRRAAGVDAGAVRPRRWTRWPTRTSRSPSRCARWSAGSRRPRPAASTTPARPRTSPVRDGCGGRCRRASTPSTPGRRPPPSSTRACPAITCRSAGRSCWPTS